MCIILLTLSLITGGRMMTNSFFPFTAIVGQEELRLALVLAAIDPRIGGVLAFGDRGTGKTTTIRSLADLLPQIKVVSGCPYGCRPTANAGPCSEGCPNITGKPPKAVLRPVPCVDLPLGIGEDRLTGALDIEKAMVEGRKEFQPGLLAEANNGFLYVDEINLLEDHIVDILLDVSASGENIVEKDGFSIKHPSRFVLIGSGNPEEGELRPQLQDRFGLAVTVTTPQNPTDRVEILKRRDAYERDPLAFRDAYKFKNGRLRGKIIRAKEALETIEIGDATFRFAAELCLELGSDGLRGELTLIKAGRARAALEGRTVVSIDDLVTLAPLVLAHRLRRDPMSDLPADASAAARVEKAVAACHERV